MQDACIATAKDEWGEKINLKDVKMPFRDAGEKAGQWAGFEVGHTFISPWTKSKPGIVNAQRQESASPRRGLGRPDGAAQPDALRLDQFRSQGCQFRLKPRPDRPHRHAASRWSRLCRRPSSTTAVLTRKTPISHSELSQHVASRCAQLGATLSSPRLSPSSRGLPLKENDHERRTPDCRDQQVP